jgi:hypothetical protein
LTEDSFFKHQMLRRFKKLSPLSSSPRAPGVGVAVVGPRAFVALPLRGRPAHHHHAKAQGTDDRLDPVLLPSQPYRALISTKWAEVHEVHEVDAPTHMHRFNPFLVSLIQITSCLPRRAHARRVCVRYAGCLPTFIDFRKNFHSPAIVEDNLIRQFRQQVMIVLVTACIGLSGYLLSSWPTGRVPLAGGSSLSSLMMRRRVCV